jgi:hypothetical protein
MRRRIDSQCSNLQKRERRFKFQVSSFGQALPQQTGDSIEHVEVWFLPKLETRNPKRFSSLKQLGLRR